MEKSTHLKVASAEAVAFDLAVIIANMESLRNDPSTYRQKFLDIYAECLEATEGRRG